MSAEAGALMSDADKLLAQVRAASSEVDAATRALVEAQASAQAHRVAAIRAALDVGASVADVAEAAGLNRSRIYQLLASR